MSLRGRIQRESTRGPVPRIACRGGDTSGGVASTGRHMLFRELLRLASSLTNGQFFFQQLLSIQLRVVSTTRNQLRVPAAFNNTAAIHDNDLVGLLHRGNTMADQY